MWHRHVLGIEPFLWLYTIKEGIWKLLKKLNVQ